MSLIASISLTPSDFIYSIVACVCAVFAVWIGYRPIGTLLLRQEEQFDRTFNQRLLMDVSPRQVTVVWLLVVAMLCMCGVLVLGATLGVLAGLAVGLFVPSSVMRLLQKRRLAKLEDQLVLGIQTLASGVRAGLNLVQSLSLVARSGPVPLRQEISHLVREYEYGMPLEEAMEKCAARVGSSDFRLLFAALQTHRERGGDLGETLDRIADAIREIQRLESRVKTLTAQGRANSRMLGTLVLVAMAIFYAIDPAGVALLFTDPVGNVILVGIAMLNVLGFLWIKKIVSIDV